MKKLILGLALTSIFCATPALANNQTKVNIAKKAIYAGKIAPYATPSFKSLLQKAHKIDDRMRKHPDFEHFGCEFSEHYYLGHGNGGPEPKDFKNLKFTTLKNGNLQANYTVWGGKISTQFKFICKNNQCLIDDAISGDFGSLKQDAQKMVKTNGCI